MCYQSDLAGIQPQLFAFVKSRVHNPSDAHDIVQNSNQVLINKEDQYNPAYSFKAWAFGIAKWQMLAYFKKNKRSQVTIPLDLYQEIPLNSNWLTDVPFSSLIKKERLDLIKGLNHILSKRQKQIFNLLIEDFTDDEIGNALGIGSKNVQATKSRLIQRIRNFVSNNKNEDYNKY
tara:strand:+ start:556 stop:1080 length:525 start_codon:yes stop_codon:yes gene_type:complete